MPMLVATERPSRTAHAEAPLPRCRITIRASGLPSSRPASRDTYSNDVPWNPNRRMPSSAGTA